MPQANVFQSMNEAFGTLQGFDEQRTRNRAGRMYAKGDPRAASNALAQGGMIEDAAVLDTNIQRREQMMSEEQREAAAARTDFMLRGVEMLRQIPAEERPRAMQQMAPTLSQLFPPEVVQQLMQGDMSDRGLEAFRAALGGEAERLQLFNTRQGVVGVNPRSGDANMLFEAPDDPTAPPGYRWTEDNNLEAIPGGPADPGVVGRVAASRRAPRQGGGSGGQRSSGGQRQSAPSRPSRPWERF